MGGIIARVTLVFPAMLLRFFLVVFLAAAAASAQPSARLFDQVGEMMSTLSEITGWRIRRAVPSQMLSKEKFRQFVETRMKQTSTREDLRIEELTLKMFGLVPQDFNLERETVDLVSEQAAAFYDYNKKRLFILDSTAPGGEQRVALVHELAHALADQQYPLGKYLRKGSPDDDGATARQAVMEGQATWLTWAYMSKRAGGKAEVPASMLAEQKQSTPSTEFPIFSREPLYLRESLVFPYDEGMRFQEAVYRKFGVKAFDEVFKHPPLTTQQILHSQSYFSGQRPVNPQSPPLAATLGKEVKRFRLLAEGSVGELDHSILLRQFIGDREGRAAASHWKGGSFRLLEHKQHKYPVLSYISEWDSAESAKTYFELYQRVLRGKWKKIELATETATEIAGSGDSGRFQIRLAGKQVLALEGLR